MLKELDGPKCSVCNVVKPTETLISAALVRPAIAELIRKDHPAWSGDSWICQHDLSGYRTAYLHTLLVADRGVVADLESEVLESLRKEELLSRNLNQGFSQQLTFGQRLADAIARFGGSWTFISGFGVVIFCWILVNAVGLAARPFDPYPFILLNLVLSCLAALQAPVIMMSQNRLEVRDRLRAEEDYRINLKAELEIRLLHEKLDHLLQHQWQRLLEIQELQLELLQEQGRQVQ